MVTGDEAPVADRAVAQEPPRGDAAAWPRRLFMVAPWVALVVAVGAAVGRAWSDPPFTPDSWVYWELGRSVYDDFFHVNTLRYYASGAAPYGSAVGPVLPVLIGTAAGLTGTAFRSGLLVNGAAVLATAACIEVAVHRERRVSGIGPAIALALLCFPLYLDDVITARSAPVTVALLSAIVLVARPACWPLRSRRAFVLGLVLGALGLTRFDQLALIVLVPLSLLVLRAASARRFLAIGGGVLVAASGWITYSLVHFGRLFATADQGDPLRGVDGRAWIPGAGPPVDVGRRITPMLDAASGVPVLWASVLAQVLFPATLLTVAVITVLFRGRGNFGWRDLRSDRLHRLVAVLALTSAVAESASMSATGVREPRYAIPLAFFTLLLVVLVITRPTPADDARRRCGIVVGIAVIAAATLLVARTPLQVASAGTWGRVRWQSTDGSFDASIPALERCTAAERPILFAAIGAGWSWGYRYGAITGRATAVEPVNVDALTPDERRRFLRTFGIGYVYGDPGDPAAGVDALADRWTAGDRTALRGGCAPGLYELDLR